MLSKNPRVTRASVVHVPNHRNKGLPRALNREKKASAWSGEIPQQGYRRNEVGSRTTCLESDIDTPMPLLQVSTRLWYESVFFVETPLMLSGQLCSDVNGLLLQGLGTKRGGYGLDGRFRLGLMSVIVVLELLLCPKKMQRYALLAEEGPVWLLVNTDRCTLPCCKERSKQVMRMFNQNREPRAACSFDPKTHAGSLSQSSLGPSFCWSESDVSSDPQQLDSS